MKKQIIFTVLISIIALSIFSCHPSTNSSSKENLKKETQGIKVVKGPKLAPINTSGQSYTTKELLSKSINEGPSFCNTLDQDFLIQTCNNQYVLYKALGNENPKTCEESKDDVFVNKCKADIIIKKVALSYHKATQTGQNINTSPYTDICNQIDNKDQKKICNDPRKTIEEDYNGIVNSFK
jgi:hypothetical protein